jgi:competence protein ComEC
MVASFWLYLGRKHFRHFISWALCAGLFVFTATRANEEIVEFQSSYQAGRRELGGPKRCSGVFTVTASPTLRTASAEGKEEERVVLWTGQSEELDCEGTTVNGPLLARLYGGPEDLSRGDRVEVVANLAPVRLFRNAGLANPVPGAARRGSIFSGGAVLAERISKGEGISAAIDRARASVRSRILATYSRPITSLGRALVLGENDLEESDADAFRNSGLLHLLAVSGTHLVIAVYALVQSLRALLVRIGPLARRFDVPRLAAGMGAILSLLYADFSGGSGSAWRAAFMLCLVCGGRSLGFRVGGPAALGGSLLVGLAIDPLAAFDFSFLLSALATAGLIGLGQPLGKLTQRGIWARAPLRPIALSLIATISSTLLCAPVLAMMDGSMTLAALFANVIAGPLGELIALPACLLHAISSPAPPIERGFALVGSGALVCVRAIALWSASVEAAQFTVPFPSAWRIALLICGSLAASTLTPAIWSSLQLLVNRKSLRPSRFIARFGVLSAALLSSPHMEQGSRAHASTSSPRPEKESHRGSFIVTALDVGQGDAFFLDFPDGSHGLVDGGGFVTGVPDTGEQVLLPYLRSRSLTHLEIVILSHPHPDHMNGLLSLSREITIGQLWIPHAATHPRSPLQTLIQRAEKKGALIRTADQLCKRSQAKEQAGTPRFNFGGLEVWVLAPCSEYSPPFGANDASLVVRMSYGERSALFTGDIEVRGEASLLQEHAPRLNSDLLKVPHHGSDTSSSRALLDAVSPSFAIISSGVRNRFDHPRRSTLAALGRTFDDHGRPTQTLRTDELGSISWSTNGRDQIIRTFTPPTHPAAGLNF